MRREAVFASLDPEGTRREDLAMRHEEQGTALEEPFEGLEDEPRPFYLSMATAAAGCPGT